MPHAYAVCPKCEEVLPAMLNLGATPGSNRLEDYRMLEHYASDTTTRKEQICEGSKLTPADFADNLGQAKVFHKLSASLIKLWKRNRRKEVEVNIPIVLQWIGGAILSLYCLLCWVVHAFVAVDKYIGISRGKGRYFRPLAILGTLSGWIFAPLVVTYSVYDLFKDSRLTPEEWSQKYGRP